MDVKKASHKNKKQMIRKHLEPSSKVEERLIEKVGIKNQTIT